MPQNAIEIKNLSKIYKLYNKPTDRLKESLHPFGRKYHKDFYSLRDINLEIKKGEVLGIVGVNGAGKSTLLKIIAGVTTPTQGSIKVNGTINAILELGSAMNAEMSGLDNIKFSLRLNEIQANFNKLVDEIIEFADIGEHIHQPVKTYSSGMKARLGFAVATITEPDILIVDEVLAVGDALFQRKCYAKIEQLFKDGKTVIFVSHSAQSVIQFCSRAVLLYDREIILEGTPKKVTDFYQKLVFSDDKKKVLGEIGQVKLDASFACDTAENAMQTQITKEPQKDTTLMPSLSTKMHFTNTNSVSQEKEYFSADLIPQSPIYYDEKGCKISDIKITTLEGKEVNVLNHSHQYVYSYKVEFFEDFSDARAQFVVKTTEGLEIAGGIYYLYKQVEGEILSGSTFLVQWKWVNIFNPNIYCLNAGIASKGDFVHRIVDAYGFKVLPVQSEIATLHIDCIYDVSFTQI